MGLMTYMKASSGLWSKTKGTLKPWRQVQRQKSLCQYALKWATIAVNYKWRSKANQRIQSTVLRIVTEFQCSLTLSVSVAFVKRKILWCRVVSRHVTLRLCHHVTLSYVTLRYVVLCAVSVLDTQFPNQRDQMSFLKSS